MKCSCPRRLAKKKTVDGHEHRPGIRMMVFLPPHSIYCPKYRGP